MQENTTNDALTENGTARNLRVMIVDDEETTQEVLKAFFLKSGYEVDVFSCPIAAIEHLETVGSKQGSRSDLIICDLQMPKLDGLGFIEKVQKLTWRPPVILLTGHGSVESAIEGLSKGAFDYITKPINFTEIAVVSDRAIKVHRLEENYRNIKRELSKTWVLDDIVGKSAPMQRLFEFIRKVGPASCNVLITGESGTGKEMVARAIHSQSKRSKKTFIAINCAAIPESLLESELFGHAKGSFTGATERRRGLFEEAHEGTVFLDEIGDMPLPLQVKVLRFLQDRTLKAVGENTYRSIDVRVIAATHQNLKEAVKAKTFREDLYYRLCVAPIEIPPLRQRREDIVLLAEHFLAKFVRKTDSRIMGFSNSALAKMTRMHWSGNVRELENTIERAAIFCETPLIEESDIQGMEVTESVAPTTELFTKLMSLDMLEKEYIQYVLQQTGNKQEKAAEILGVNRKTLYRKQQLYNSNVHH